MSPRRSPILVLLLLVATACTGPSGGSVALGVVSSGPAVASASSGPAAAASSVAPGVDTSFQAAATQAIDAFNRTAGGSVAAQQAMLGRLVSTGQQAVQQRCPTATSTISFDPIYSRLATAPGWKPSSGTLPGTVYALPTLIRIYRGDRIVGTDLTDLHLTIDGGAARLPALCLT